MLQTFGFTDTSKDVILRVDVRNQTRNMSTQCEN